MNLNEAIKNIKSNKDAENFLKDLCTPSELKALEESCLLYTSPSPRDDR